jgi:hypothetical protein
LSRGDRAVPQAAAGEEELASLLFGGPDVAAHRFPGLLGQLKPDRMSGFPLTDGRAIHSRAMGSNVLDFETDDVATAELAVDSEIEQG